MAQLERERASPEYEDLVGVEVDRGIIITSPGFRVRPAGVLAHISDLKHLARTNPAEYSVDDDGSFQSFNLVFRGARALPSGLSLVFTSRIESCQQAVQKLAAAKELVEKRRRDLAAHDHDVDVNKPDPDRRRRRELSGLLEQASAELSSLEQVIGMEGRILGLPSYRSLLASYTSYAERRKTEYGLMTAYDGDSLGVVIQVLHDLLPFTNIPRNRACDRDPSLLTPLDITQALEYQLESRGDWQCSDEHRRFKLYTDGPERHRNFKAARELQPKLEALAHKYDPAHNDSPALREAKLAEFMHQAHRLIQEAHFVFLGPLPAVHVEATQGKCMNNLAIVHDSLYI
eukprot:tig00021073_g18011.t1